MITDKETELDVVTKEYLDLFPESPYPVTLEQTSVLNSFVGNMKQDKDEFYLEADECIEIMRGAIKKGEPLKYKNMAFE